jgi:hypothetical protein
MRVYSVIGLLGALIVLGGCGTSRSRPDYSGFENLRPDLRPEQLRLRLDEFAARYSGIVETAADAIIHEAKDPVLQRRALRWKMRAIPACHLAVFRNEPLASLIDTMVLCHQMAQFFTVGAGKDCFGPHQDVAIRTAKQLETEIDAVAETVTKGTAGLTNVQIDVDAWAEENPIQSLNFTRNSPIRLFADQARRAEGVFDAVDSMEDRIQQLSTRLRFYVHHLPRQSRWEAELLVDEIFEVTRLEQGLRNLDSITRSMDKVSTVIEGVPDLVRQERQALLEALEEQRESILESLERQRIDTIRTISEERIATVQAVKEERIAVTADVDALVTRSLDSFNAQRLETVRVLRAERQETIQALREERAALAKDFDGIAARTIEQTAPRLSSLIDHFFWRLVQVIGAALVLSPLVVFFFLRLFRARR